MHSSSSRAGDSMTKGKGAKYIHVLEARMVREIRMSGNGIGPTAEVRGGKVFSVVN